MDSGCAPLLGIPAIRVGNLLLRDRNRPIFCFGLALVAVALGYLGWLRRARGHRRFRSGLRVAHRSPVTVGTAYELRALYRQHGNNAAALVPPKLLTWTGACGAKPGTQKAAV